MSVAKETVNMFDMKADDEGHSGRDPHPLESVLLSSLTVRWLQFGFARRFRCFSREDVEELVQDTLLQAHRALKGFRARASSFQAWLLRVATSAAIDRLRAESASKRPRLVLRGALEALSRPNAGAWQAPAIPERLLPVRRFLTGLPDVERDAVQLVFIAGYSRIEAAHLLKSTGGAMRQALHRVRVKLRALLTAHPGILRNANPSSQFNESQP